RRRIALAEIRTPIAGVVYDLVARPGGFVNAGDRVASLGRLERVRVRVWVDEPELGRLAAGQNVTITWDALPGSQWTGAVEKLPAEVVALGTRQVGEVLCTIENRDGKLVPGTNVNAEIRARVVEGALTVPKEAVRREGGEAGVLVLREGRVEWRKVTLGFSSATRSQIAQGLDESDAVALPGDRPLRSGDAVKPIHP
ncbi:MAG: efflux RND transporter periplasmic adaptor subunit, partial [Bryobacteraceae bacterium]